MQIHDRLSLNKDPMLEPLEPLEPFMTELSLGAWASSIVGSRGNRGAATLNSPVMSDQGDEAECRQTGQQRVTEAPAISGALPKACNDGTLKFQAGVEKEN